MKWKRIENGVYESADGQYRIQRGNYGWDIYQDGTPRKKLTIIPKGTLPLAKAYFEKPGR